MNYFGHAAIAVRRLEAGQLPLHGEDSAARFLLGSMLPDLLAMVRAPLPHTFREPALAAGVAFHMEVDGIFHQTDSFVNWSRTALVALRERGVSRGPARACAHIGVEMLIDAQLVSDAELYAGYLRGLQAGARTEASLLGLDLEKSSHLGGLCQHLLDRGRSVHVTTKERLVFRLGRTLSGRARLEPTPAELESIAAYLGQFRAVEEGISTLMQELSPLWQVAETGGLSSN